MSSLRPAIASATASSRPCGECWTSCSSGRTSTLQSRILFIISCSNEIRGQACLNQVKGISYITFLPCCWPRSVTVAKMIICWNSAPSCIAFWVVPRNTQEKPVQMSVLVWAQFPLACSLSVPISPCCVLQSALRAGRSPRAGNGAVRFGSVRFVLRPHTKQQYVVSLVAFTLIFFHCFSLLIVVNTWSLLSFHFRTYNWRLMWKNYDQYFLFF